MLFPGSRALEYLAIPSGCFKGASNILFAAGTFLRESNEKVERASGFPMADFMAGRWFAFCYNFQRIYYAANVFDCLVGEI